MSWRKPLLPISIVGALLAFWWSKEDQGSFSTMAAFTTGLSAFIVLYQTASGLVERRRLESASPESQLDGAAKRLADIVAAEVAAEERLRRLHDPWPLQVRWVNTSRRVMDHWQAVRGEPGNNEPIDLAGAFGEIYDRFDAVPSRRLVILGEPGSGKTVLALRLMRDLLKRRRQPQDPVPVLFPLSSWNPAQVSLHTWMIAWLSDNYNFLRVKAISGATLAKGLVEAGRILPLLDGLDEVSDPLRAAALVEINRAFTRGDALVLTSRASEYEDATKAEDGDVLSSAAVIEFCEFDNNVLRDYLGVTTSQARAGKWDSIFEDIDRNPRGPVAQALSTPLMVWLARTVYGDTRSQPSELLIERYPQGRLYDTRATVEGCIFLKGVNLL